MHNGKRGKKVKDKAKLLKRFLTGENVIDAIVNDGIPRITGFIIWDGSEKIAEITKGAVIWHEQRTYDDYKPSKKTYPDSEIEGIRYDNPANALTEKEATVKPEINAQSIEARQVVNRSKQYLTDKLRQFAEQEKIDLEEREKFILWKRMNSSL